MPSGKYTVLAKRSTIIIVFISLIACSCANNYVSQILEHADSVMEEHPDSALSILKTLDTSRITSDKTKARFALLHSMALDKNYIDTSDTGVITPAVDYYSKYGSSDEKLKTYFYLGRIQKNSGNINKAAISYSLAEREIRLAEDPKMKGILFIALADIYNNIHNIEKEKEYVLKGLDQFRAADDSARYNLSLGRLAIVYHSESEWEKADSLYQVVLRLARKDTSAIPVFLSNYARMKMIQPSQDSKGAISLLQRMSSEYGGSLSIGDYGVYAYSSDLLETHGLAMPS